MKLFKREKFRQKSFFQNSSSIFILQISNYAFPFLLIPYLTNILGAELYGITAFGLSISQIACIVTDYGFNLSATYKISKNRENTEFLNKTISAVLICKVFLLITILSIFSIYITFQTTYGQHKTFLVLMFLVVIGQTFQPIWFFQGIEKMINITIYTLIARTSYLLTVILLVKSPTDYNLVALANGLSQILAAAIGLGIVLKQGYTFRWPGTTFIKETFKYSTDFFWSRAAVATYTSFGTFFLGIASSPLQVAYYSAAEQLYKGAQAMFSPISQALYPYMAKHRDVRLFIKVLVISMVTSLFCCGIGVIVGQQLIDILFGNQFKPVYSLLLQFLVTFLITVPSILLGYPFLGAFDQISKANKSVLYAGGVQCFLLATCYVLGLTKGTYVAASVLLVEITVLFLRAIWALKIYQTLQNETLEINNSINQ